MNPHPTPYPWLFGKEVQPTRVWDITAVKKGSPLISHPLDSREGKAAAGH